MLVVYWKLNGNTLDTTLTGPDGVLTGTPNWVAGRLGTDTALKFDGITNYMTAGNTLNLSGQFSILMWVKLGTSTTGRALISKGESIFDKDQNYGIMFTPANRVVFPIGDGVNYRTFLTNNVIPDTNWHHIAAVFVSSTDMQVYVDGVLQSGTYTGTATTPAVNVMRTIVGASSTTTELFDGTIQEIRIHDTALSAGQVIAEYGGCPALSATLSLVSSNIPYGGTIDFTSTAIGGVPTNDGFGHEILIDGTPVYNSGLGQATVVSGSISTTGLSSGSHNVVSRITDGCIPTHQVAISTPISINYCALSVCTFELT
jgi:hypothetical protein